MKLYFNGLNNPEFKNKEDGKFAISTPATDYSTDKFLYTYFSREHFVPLAEILTTVNERTKL